MNLVLSEAGHSIDSGAGKLALVLLVYLVNHSLNAKVMILSPRILRQNSVFENLLKIKLKLFQISEKFCIELFSKILVLLHAPFDVDLRHKFSSLRLN